SFKIPGIFHSSSMIGVGGVVKSSLYHAVQSGMDVPIAPPKNIGTHPSSKFWGKVISSWAPHANIKGVIRTGAGITGIGSGHHESSGTDATTAGGRSASVLFQRYCPAKTGVFGV